MNIDQIRTENNILMCNTDFARNREQFWVKFGGSPIQAAVRLAVRVCGKAAALKIADLGCGSGADLEFFSVLLQDAGHAGSLEAIGCDISPAMVQHCVKKGLNVIEANFLECPVELSGAQLVWAHFSIVHLGVAELHSAVAAMAGIAATPSVVCVGFKTGSDVTRIDPADERIPIDREQTFFRPETVSAALAEVGFKAPYRIMLPSADPAYDYCWILGTKD